jgi:hypothetical protein
MGIDRRKVTENKTVENMERIFKCREGRDGRTAALINCAFSRKRGPDNGRGGESYEIAAYKQ